MTLELVDVLKRLAAMRCTSLEHEIMKHNAEVTERHRANGKPLPCANEEERVARKKAARKRGVDKAREKRRAATEANRSNVNR